MSKTWFTAKAGNDNEPAEIAIYDEIGLWGISASNFRDSLRALGTPKQINLSINSPGGSVFDGIAIHNMLARSKAKVVVTIDGIAASIASVIAMAGNEIIMPENAMMMIHNPSGVVVGQSKDMREVADALDKIREALIASYSRTGLDRAEIEAMLDAETWLTADEAIEQGFADKKSDRVKIAARFDLNRFVSPPSNLRASSKKERQMTTQAAATTPAVDPTAPTLPAPVAPVAPAPVVAPAPEANQVQASERARSRNIVDICALAGSNRAGEFIASDMTIEQITAAIRADRTASATAAPGAGSEVQTTNNSANTAAGQQAKAPRIDPVAFMKQRHKVA